MKTNTRQLLYLSPLIAVSEIEVEQGIASSDQNIIYDLDYQPYYEE